MKKAQKIVQIDSEWPEWQVVKLEDWNVQDWQN
jgi:hypothetical protein